MKTVFAIDLENSLMNHPPTQSTSASADFTSAAPAPLITVLAPFACTAIESFHWC